MKRFDRDGEKRIHFASAMTLLGKTDGASAEDGVSYLDMAGFIKAYGVNPVPYGDELSLLVDSEDNSISVDLAIRTAPRFGITEKDATKLSGEILVVVRDNWERLAKEYGLSRGQIENMRPAFSACYDM